MSELKQEIKPTEEALRLLEAYLEAEKELLAYIESLNNYGKECECEDSNSVEIQIADEGAIPYCLVCGGVDHTQEWVAQ